MDGLSRYLVQTFMFLQGKIWLFIHYQGENLYELYNSRHHAWEWTKIYILEQFFQLSPDYLNKEFIFRTIFANRVWKVAKLATLLRLYLYKYLHFHCDQAMTMTLAFSSNYHCISVQPNQATSMAVHSWCLVEVSKQTRYTYFLASV